MPIAREDFYDVELADVMKLSVASQYYCTSEIANQFH